MVADLIISSVLLKRADAADSTGQKDKGTKKRRQEGRWREGKKGREGEKEEGGKKEVREGEREKRERGRRREREEGE